VSVPRRRSHVDVDLVVVDDVDLNGDVDMVSTVDDRAAKLTSLSPSKSTTDDDHVDVNDSGQPPSLRRRTAAMTHRLDLAPAAPVAPCCLISTPTSSCTDRNGLGLAWLLLCADAMARLESIDLSLV